MLRIVKGIVIWLLASVFFSCSELRSEGKGHMFTNEIKICCMQDGAY